MKNSYRIHQRIETLLEMEKSNPNHIRWVHPESIEQGTQEVGGGVWHHKSPGEGWVKASKYNSELIKQGGEDVSKEAAPTPQPRKKIGPQFRKPKK